MSRIRVFAAASVAAVLLLRVMGGDGDSADADEALDRTACRLIENVAPSYGLPVPFLTRLIFKESGFRADAVSRSGALGIAQFMPATAATLGLADPLDPEQAIPQAARHLSDLRARFGNLGLAAAAYNGGPTRVSGWLSGRSELGAETRAYVAFVSGSEAESWRAESWRAEAEPLRARLREASLVRRSDGLETSASDAVAEVEPPCLQHLAELRIAERKTRLALVSERRSRAAPERSVALARADSPMARPASPKQASRQRVAEAARPVSHAMARPRSPARPTARPSGRLALTTLALLSDEAPWRSLSGGMAARHAVAGARASLRTRRAMLVKAGRRVRPSRSDHGFERSRPFAGPGRSPGKSFRAPP